MVGKDLTNKRFGSLVAKYRTRRLGRTAWFCQCDCGETKVILTFSLTGGKSKSCGCNKGETHGKSNDPAYDIWSNMVARCTNKNHPRYSDYGGRGIHVCEEWLDITNFLTDIGNRPSKYHTLDRRDNDKGYYKSNCRWATGSTQNNNTRRSIKVNGYALTELSRAYRVSACTIRDWKQIRKHTDNEIMRKLRKRQSVEGCLVCVICNNDYYTKDKQGVNLRLTPAKVSLCNNLANVNLWVCPSCKEMVSA